MTKSEFDKIVSAFRDVYKQGFNTYNSHSAREDRGMWNVVMGKAYPKSATKPVIRNGKRVVVNEEDANAERDPSVVYDIFLGAFGLSKTMDQIPWNENVHLFEGWTNKGDDVFFVNAAMDKSKENEKETMVYRFSANSCINGVFGELPFKCQSGWRFEVVFTESDGEILGHLKVLYKNEKISLTERFVCIQRCQLALVDFLKVAREFFFEKRG